MTDNPLVGIATIFGLGVGAQWVAWRLRMPAILLLLLAGIMAGPGTAWMAQQGWLSGPLLDPGRLLGRLLLPLVSLSVGIILFEGGLTLTFNQVTRSVHVVAKLVTIGAGVTWIASTLAGRYLLDIPPALSVLLGAILVVTGPTVVGPLLRDVRPVGQVGAILRWEGIIIDPIGVLLTVLVFQAISSGQELQLFVAREVLTTVAVGTGLGLAGAVALIILLRRYWVPDYLQNPVTLMIVAVAFAASNAIQHESGLFATTVMGMALANQRYVSIHHIQEFKENLSVLLISCLFIVLGARLTVEQITQVRWPHVVFIVSLILVARPLAVLASTLGPGITWRERFFLSWMAPRGVVAASVASVFGIELTQAGIPGGNQIVPAVFAVIVGTVTVYGLTASWVARRLGLAKPDASGVLIVGANPLARTIGKALHEDGFEVLLADTNQEHASEARLAGLPVFFGSVNSEQVLERIQLSGIGRLLALTPNDTVNALAATRYARVFGRAEAYTLRSNIEAGSRGERVSHEYRGRPLFGREVTYQDLEKRIEAGAVIKRTKLTEQYPLSDFQRDNPDAVPLFLVEPRGVLLVVAGDAAASARAGQTLISLAQA